ncbi:hypothetical protein [Wukongibacter sp. M2B1]|uniref:hypothetical protein n=1 Tax=Wukongibacter sp. M2B1 TaxID=3088895 RepID=UPI003D7910B9
MSRKRTWVIQLLVVLVACSIPFMEKKFSEPYKVVDNIIKDARENKSIAEYLVEKDEDWEEIEEKTMYKIVRREIDWKFFKDFINDKNVESINYSRKGTLIYKIKNFLRKETSVTICAYDSQGNKLNDLRMLLLKTEEGWRVIGTANDKDIKLINKSKILPSDIEEYIKNSDQVNVKLLSQKLNMNEDLFDSDNVEVRIVDKIVTKLSSDNKSDILLLLLTQRGFSYQFLVFNKEKNDYNFIGNISFGYKHEVEPTFRIATIDENHRYIVIKTQAGYGTGINIKEERWYGIEKDKITKVLEYPVEYVMVPPPTVSYPIKVLGEVVNTELVDGVPKVEVDFTISYMYDTSYDTREETKISINKKAEYILEDNKFISEIYEGEYDDWIYNQEINNEILDKNFKKLMEISKSEDQETINYLLRFLESCKESDKKEAILDNILNYPYIKLRGDLSSALIPNGVSLNQPFIFEYRNLDEDIKRVFLWYEEFNKGKLISDNRIRIAGLTNKDDELGFGIVNEDGVEKIKLSAGQGSSTTDIERELNSRLFIVANSEKMRIKKNKEIILGFIVWDVEDTKSTVYSFDNSQSIINAFSDYKIFIFKCMLVDSDFDDLE